MSSVHWKEVTAIFGGTFDPPHLGHLTAVKDLFENPGIKRVWVLPSRHPLLKETITPFENRMQMTQILFEETARSFPIEVIDPSVFLKSEKDYTTLLLREIHKTISETAFVIGTDQLEQLPQWARFPEVLGQTHWIVLARKPDGMTRAKTILHQWVMKGILRSETEIRISGLPPKTIQLVETSAPEISSSEIRRAIALHGQAPKYSLSSNVWNYLCENHLYGTRKEKP